MGILATLQKYKKTREDLYRLNQVYNARKELYREMKNDICEKYQKEIDKDKNVDIDAALKKFGEIVKGDIQETILNGGFVRNAPSTVKRKGQNMPLIDTGVMISSIQARTDKELLDV